MRNDNQKGPTFLKMKLEDDERSQSLGTAMQSRIKKAINLLGWMRSDSIGCEYFRSRTIPSGAT